MLVFVVAVLAEPTIVAHDHESNQKNSNILTETESINLHFSEVISCVDRIVYMMWDGSASGGQLVYM